MNITTHCRERYVERIMEIDDPKGIRDFAKEHLKDIEEIICKLYANGQPIFYGKLGRDKKERSFIINKDIVMVIAENEDTILTLYKVDFGFPEETNKKVVQDLIEEIQKKNKEIEEKALDNSHRNNKRELEIDNIKLSIEAFETRIKELEAKKRLLYQEKETDDKTLEALNIERDRLCKMICNSLDYKLDLLAM